MTKNIFKRGFTLIELLVVIAIIGILAAVVLASLNNARDKGEDANATASLNNSRAQAELYYDNNGRSYDGVCTAAGSANPGGIATLLQGADDAVGNTPTCGDDAESWAVEVELNADPDGDGTNDFYCVDYRGIATTTEGTTVNTDAVNGDNTFNNCG